MDFCKIHNKPLLRKTNSTISVCLACEFDRKKKKHTAKEVKPLKQHENGFKTNIRKVSKKQAAVLREIGKIKKSLDKHCIICGKPACDPAHLLPRSIESEYIKDEWNIVPMCRDCHNKYDNDIEFRRQQTHLYLIIQSHDAQAADRYFYDKKLTPIKI